MSTATDLRRAALALPGAGESSHQDHPDFRVRGRIFATIWPDGAQGVLRLGPETRAALVDAKPNVFSVPKGGQQGGWTLVQFRGVKPAELRALVEEAWRGLASKKQLAELDSR